ncbi:Xaa-Pro dipeptidyl-peptidase [Lactiplantibacillus xiangfangensis]|uniref:Xaa-Pro dipeptidyl-peptidase n=1 Tax=Lactiplantibacillus xiangfangensis TaxID=942150 RepID=A0A0R2MB80_9LACO|nr:Xaa-Pro dipeptidyl-peptidase [Lactiplantibacillus xiangfangensis]KRO09021.1 xaa-pro dipeptidyl-peptidase [Lactiplantibacillus xiangfangensis]
MINNQFAIVPTDSEAAIAELTKIHFITPAMTSLTTVPAVYRALLAESFPEVKTTSGLKHKFANLMATSQLNLNEWLENATVVNNQVFYNVGLQLLGFLPGQDFDLADPLLAMRDIHLPMVADSAFDRESLYYAWYLLLNTRGNNGQTLIEALTARGYFVPFYQLPNEQKPLFFNGKAQAVFNTNDLIRDVVYVEAPLDTDHDGKRDLLKVEILRPAETATGLKVPVLYTASPYNQGINDHAGEAQMHNVDVPLTAKTPDTNTYEDVEYQPQTPDLPAERPVKTTSDDAEETFGREKSYTLNDYFLARGFAVVYAAGIGSVDSDGLAPTGDIDETTSTVAIIEWLTGKRHAFTNRDADVAIKAWWTNGSVAMTGRSYLGTLATAAATTGVDGLKTIISEAAISSWYDYYRDNGLVVAPDTFQGEDTDVLAAEVFSRSLKSGDAHRIQSKFDEKLAELTKDQDRDTGNYNRYWDERNYLKNVDKIKADIVMVHGLNDWNVKPRNVANLWDKLQKVPVTKKLILHQGQHIYINNLQSLDFTDMMNLWLSHELYGLDNHAESLLPNVLVQDNTKAETWHGYDNWWQDSTQSLDFKVQYKELVPADHPVDQRAAHFTDKLPDKLFKHYQQDLNAWQTDLLSESKTNPLYDHRLLFKSWQAPSDQLLVGRPHVQGSVAVNKNFGMLSFMLIDFGEAKRLTVSPQMIAAKALDLGFHWREDDLKDFKLAPATPFKMITKGHLNLQNRHHPWHAEAIQPNEFYDFELDLQPIFHHLLKGHQVGLVIYGTDMKMTIRGNQDLQYSLNLNDIQLHIPVKSIDEN